MNIRDKLLQNIKIEDRGYTTPCWIWQKGTLSGYGWLGRKYTHRASYELFKNDFNADLCILHKCDIRLCINPEHLFQGTRTDNARDKVKKGRVPFGVSLPQTKLSEEDVLTIIKRWRAGEKQVALAKEYGINASHVSGIASGRKRATRVKIKLQR